MPTPAARVSPEELAILRSVLYGALFEYPLTLGELHQTLTGAALSEAGILAAYEASGRLAAWVEYREGHFFPAGRADWIANRRDREARSRALLDANRGVLQVIAMLPFVRLLALSGSLAVQNADRRADLDLFIVTRGRRVWSVTVAVILLAKLMRRRHLVCANFVMTDTDLAVEQHDLFTANQIIHLRPLTGESTYRAFLAANPFVGVWYPNFRPEARAAFPFGIRGLPPWLRSVAETLLAVPSWAIEACCRHAYGAYLRRRAASWPSPDQVRLRPDYLKLHTRSHRKTILDRFEQSVANVLGHRPPRVPGDPDGARPVSSRAANHEAREGHEGSPDFGVRPVAVRPS